MGGTSSASFKDFVSDHNRETSSFYDSLCHKYKKLIRLNPYYRSLLKKWLRARLPEGRRVIEFGCGDGFFLDATSPSDGLGIDCSDEFIATAKTNYPDYSFDSSSIEEFQPNRKFDAVLLMGVVEYVFDIGVVVEKAYESLDTNGRLYVTTGNPLWKPIFSLATKLGLRTPDRARNYITNKDLINLIKVYGFELVSEEMNILVPKWIPILGPFLNWIFPRIPAIKYLCSTQMLVARKIDRSHREYSTSIVIPCYNEEGNIKRCVESVLPVGTHTEVIFVDDASKDGTLEEIKKHSQLRHDIEVRHLTYEKNKGKGYAVKFGFDKAKGDIIFILDADLTTHPEELKTLYSMMSNHRAEFVNCTRMIYPMEKGAMKWANYVGNKLFNILVSHVMEERVSDTLCGTKACFKKDYQYFQMGRDPWGDYDFLFGAAQLKLTCLELPVHYRERIAGFSKMQSLKHAKNLLKMCFYGFFQIKFRRPLVKKNF